MPNEIDAALDEQIKQVNEIMLGSNLSQRRKDEILLTALSHYATEAQEKADQSAGGDFLKILMQLLIQFLPLLLKLLGGV